MRIQQQLDQCCVLRDSQLNLWTVTLSARLARPRPGLAEPGSLRVVPLPRRVFPFQHRAVCGPVRRDRLEPRSTIESTARLSERSCSIISRCLGSPLASATRRSRATSRAPPLFAEEYLRQFRGAPQGGGQSVRLSLSSEMPSAAALR